MIAETLLDKETITAEEVDYLVKNGHLPPVEKPVVESEKPAETELKPENAEISEEKPVQKEEGEVEKPVDETPVEKPVDNPPSGEGEKPE